MLYLHAAQALLRLLPPPIKQTTDRAGLSTWLLLFPPVHLEFRRVEDGDGVDGVGHVVKLKESYFFVSLRLIIMWERAFFHLVVEHGDDGNDPSEDGPDGKVLAEVLERGKNCFKKGKRHLPISFDACRHECLQRWRLGIEWV